MASKDRIQNVNPRLFSKTEERQITTEEQLDDVVDEFDAREVFDLIRNITDPEHPLSLEELNVVDVTRVRVDNANNSVEVDYTPTIPHCSMATLIGLSIRVCLLRSLPSRFKVTVRITDGTHSTEHAINKQIADKERVAAALENNNLLEVVNQCLSKSWQ